ncbi:MAG: helix-turn-helix domain-containing protein [Pseudohongiellaceae bacterium]
MCDFGSLILDADILSPDQLQLINESCNLKKTSILIISSDISLGAELVARRSGASMFFRRPMEVQPVIESLRLLHHVGAQEGSPVWMLDAVESTLCSPSGISIKLTQTELAFLEILAARPMEVVSNPEITDNLFKEFDTDAEHRLAMLLTRLRRKFKFHGLASPVRSVFGKGRVFAADIATVDKQRKEASHNFDAQAVVPRKMSSNHFGR